MDQDKKLSRKELKQMVRHDRFAEEVEHTVEYVAGHRKQVIIGAVALLAVVLASFGIYWYMQKKQVERQAALAQALRVYDAAIGPNQNEFVVTFPTVAEKRKAVNDAFTKLATQYGSSDEGVIAQYYLAVAAADEGRIADAEKMLRKVIADGDKEYASLARLALAEALAAQNRRDEAERLLRELMANPSIFVSKEQATMTLARIIAPVRPDEARKLLEPLRTERSAISRAAIEALSSIPNK